MYFNYNLTKKKKYIINLIILGIFSLLINQHYANRGVFPIDSFLIFDAAYNITVGNHPFKDYWLITGPFVDYVQSLFFLLFGVNWFSYTLHASIFNMFLCLSSFYFFSRLGLNQLNTFLYSLGIAMLAYPSIGTPFIDHHSVILSLLAVYSLILGILFKNNLFWFLTPVLIIFSFFSKQIPSVYLAIFFSLAIFYLYLSSTHINKKNIVFLLFGTLFTFIIIIGIIFINEIPIKNFLIQYIFYPVSLGESRIESLNINSNNILNQFKFIYLCILPLIIYIFFYLKKKLNNNDKKYFICSLIFIGSIIIFIYCQLLTKNQVLIFFLIPVSAAFSHIYIKKYLKKKYLIYFVMLIFVFSTAKYHIRFNQNKKFMELVNADLNLAIAANKLDQRFGKLKWISPYYLENPETEIDLLINTKNILLNKHERKIIITDYQFFSSFLENKFASPNKWYDNLSVPNKKNKYYNDHKFFFMSKLKDNKISFLYFIGKDKHKMDFFRELIDENECITKKRYNEILIEFSIKQCQL
mgnify:CR=1 FL=1|jgi:hypothetical protein